MTKSTYASNSDITVRRWRGAAIVCGVTAAASIALLAATAFLATQTLGTDYNLYYLLWKAGLRSYERPIAFGGLFQDRQRFIGMSLDQFQRTFPGTFYKVCKAPPIAKPNHQFYVDDYRKAEDENDRLAFCWVAVFEDGRLIELDVSKP